MVVVATVVVVTAPEAAAVLVGHNSHRHLYPVIFVPRLTYGALHTKVSIREFLFGFITFDKSL